MKLPATPVVSVSGRFLPRNINNWTLWDQYLGQFRSYKKKYIPWLEERLPLVKPIKPTKYGYFDFRCFLESVPDEKTGEVDYLWVKSYHQDGTVYHIRGRMWRTCASFQSLQKQSTAIANMFCCASPAVLIFRSLLLRCKRFPLQRRGLGWFPSSQAIEPGATTRCCQSYLVCWDTLVGSTPQTKDKRAVSIRRRNSQLLERCQDGDHSAQIMRGSSLCFPPMRQILSWVMPSY